MGARSNLFRSAAREGVVIRGREFHEFDYANPAFNEIIKCIGTNFGKKKNCVGNFCISGNGRLLSATTDRGIPTTTLRGGRNRFAPDLHNSVCAWTLDRILSCVESCVFEERLMGTGWITIHWGIYGSEEEERKQMQMHAIRGEVSFFFFFLVFLTSLRFCLWVSFCKVGGISKGGRLTVRQSYRWYKSNDAIKV